MVNSTLYSKLVEIVNLDDIFIKDLSMTRYPVSLRDGEELDADIKMDPQLHIVNNDHLIASVHFGVSAKTKDDSVLFSIEFEYGLVYSISEEEIFSEEDLFQVASLFVERNVPINAWPFARELIADLSTRMNVPRLLIGMYRYIPDGLEESQSD